MGKNPLIDGFWLITCSITYAWAFKPWQDWGEKVTKVCPRCSAQMEKVRSKDYWYCTNGNCNNVIRNVKVGA